MADTKLTIQQIEKALHDSGIWNVRSDVMIPNLSWGLLNHEADFVVLSKDGYLTEVEIKRSFSDLKADFKKDIFHRDERVYRFYYCIPESIADKANKLFSENADKIRELYNVTQNGLHDKPAIILYNERGGVWFDTKSGYPYRHNTRKLFLEERETVGRLMSLRYWKLIDKTVKLPDIQTELFPDIPTEL